MKPDETTIAIMKEQVSARHERVPIHELQFLPDNPRVYAAIREMSDVDDLTPEEKQTRIYERLLLEPSVKKLKPEIERDGGLQDPITVRWDRRQVIEGNSRLAVYRKLWKETRDERWASIRCLVVTELTDDQQTRLLAQTHLHGRQNGRRTLERSSATAGSRMTGRTSRPWRAYRALPSTKSKRTLRSSN